MILKNNLITRVSANCSEFLQRIFLQERREVTFLMNIMFFSRETRYFCVHSFTSDQRDIELIPLDSKINEQYTDQ